MSAQLNQGQIAIHPLIIAELALGSLGDRNRTLGLLDRLPQVRMAHVNEIRRLIEDRRLYGLGIGIVDVHLLASVLISYPALLWTRDKRLRAIGEKFGIHADLP